MARKLRSPTRARALAAAGVLVVVAGALVVWAAWPDRPRPNVLLVSIDSLRHDHLGCYGYERPTSPTIDALARDGALFREAVAPSSWTLPSHVTLLTAKPPEQHGVVHPRKRLAPGTPTLARALRDAGYATAAFVAAPFLRSVYGYADGFDVYDETVARPGNLQSHAGVTSPALVQSVATWLARWRERRPAAPFFVFLHLWDVHYDFDPPPPYDTMFDPHYGGSVDGRDFELGKQVHARMDRRDLKHVIALYDGEIRYTDEHLGEVLALLRAASALDDTIVVVTSDHGEEFFEHGHKGHGKSLYDETLRIPLVVRYPGEVLAGTVVEQQVRLMDVAPTILGLAGVAPPAGFGAGDVAHRDRDLSPWLTAAETEQPFPELLAFGELSLRPGRPLFSVRTPARKTIFAGRRDIRQEAYDLVADPGEKTNLLSSSGAHRADLADLAAEHDAWLAHWRGTAPLARPAKLDAQHVGRLRALGYVE